MDAPALVFSGVTTGEREVPRKLLLHLPKELIQNIIEAIDEWHLFPTLGAMRLTCKQLSSIVTPRLLRRIKAIAHLYFLERLADVIKSGFALSEHVREIELDTHSTVNVAAMYHDAYQAHGVVSGVVEARYVQPERNGTDCQLETEALLAVFHLLKNLQSVVLNLTENHDPARPDPWATSLTLNNLQDRLQIPDWTAFEHLHRQNWHFEIPSVLLSILHAIHQSPMLPRVAFRSFNLARLGCAASSKYPSLACVMYTVISKLSHVSFDLVVEEEDDFEFDPGFENFTDGPGSLLRSLENCINLDISYNRAMIGHGDDMMHASESEFGNRFTCLHASTPWPIMSKLESIFLGNMICVSQDLLKIMTVYYPCLKRVALYNLRIVNSPSIRERHEIWTNFLKELKANTNLTSLWFCGLYAPRRISLRDHPGPMRTGRAPDLYTETISWFHDASLGDDECPLNDFHQANGLRRFYCHCSEWPDERRGFSDEPDAEIHACYGHHVSEG